MRPVVSALFALALVAVVVLLGLLMAGTFDRSLGFSS